MKVLDLGCGDGTTAVPEARLGATVMAIDIARNLVEAGNKRAQEVLDIAEDATRLLTSRQVVGILLRFFAAGDQQEVISARGEFKRMRSL